MARRADQSLSRSTALRALLRDNPVGEGLAIAYEQDHSFGPETLAVRQEGRIQGMVTRRLRPAWVNGRPGTAAWLAQARVDRRCEAPLAVISAGARGVQRMHRDRRASYYLATLLEGSRMARLLSSGRLGLPRARLRDQLKTFSMRPRRLSAAGREGLQEGVVGREAAWRDLCTSEFRRFQFAPRALPPRGEVLTLLEAGRLVGAAILSPARTMRLARLPAAWRLARSWLNLAAPRLLGWPLLPAQGELLHDACAAWFCVRGWETGRAQRLLAGLLDLAARRGYRALNLCLSEAHPVAGSLAKAFGGLELRSRLALLHWEDGLPALKRLDTRPAFIDISEL